MKTQDLMSPDVRLPDARLPDARVLEEPGSTSGRGFTVARVETAFPEPDFSLLQRQVFAGVEQASDLLAAALSVEGEQQQRAPSPLARVGGPVVRFAAFVDDGLVGWSYGWFEVEGSFYMANSGVSPSCRRRGIYAALLEAVIEHARTAGSPLVRSRHSVLNNPVIICKLQRGFQVAGFGVSARLGGLVELVHHLTPERQALFAARTVPFNAGEED